MTCVYVGTASQLVPSDYRETVLGIVSVRNIQRYICKDSVNAGPSDRASRLLTRSPGAWLNVTAPGVARYARASSMYVTGERFRYVQV